jgi:hypothetical protein
MEAWTVLPGLIAVAVAFVLVPVGLGAYTAYRRGQVVSCPLGGEDARIAVDARHAALAALLGSRALRVTACSFWPERRGCARACLPPPAAAGGVRPRAA